MTTTSSPKIQKRFLPMTTTRSPEGKVLSAMELLLE